MSTYRCADHPLGLFFLHIVLTTYSVDRPLGLLCLYLHIVLTLSTWQHIVSNISWSSWPSPGIPLPTGGKGSYQAVHVKGDQKWWNWNLYSFKLQIIQTTFKQISPLVIIWCSFSSYNIKRSFNSNILVITIIRHISSSSTKLQKGLRFICCS